MKKTHKLSQIEIAAIKHRWTLGEDRHDIADCFDVSEFTVRYHCRDLPRQLDLSYQPIAEA